MTTDPLGFADEALDALLKEELLRGLTDIESGPGPEVVVGGERLINFSSNNYLGLAEHPALAEATAEAARRWGAGATASRLIVGTHGLVRDLEQRLAILRGTEAALVFPTGYQANLGTVGALMGRGDLIVADKLCHASLIDAARLSGATLRTFAHGDLALLEERLAKHPERGRMLVMTDGVFSMDGDLCHLRDLVEITAHHGALLLVDDAHAVGVLGKTGAGICEHFGIAPPRHLILTATLSKALGSQGGFVCGPRRLTDLLVNRARTFIFTTGLAPPAAAAALAALDVIDREPERRERLSANRERLASALKAKGWDLGGSVTPIIPLMAGTPGAAMALAARLRSNGILGVPIRPPTVPRGASRVRLSVMSTHTDAHLDALIDAVGDV
ncbi:8-amino-7-oxononanoate synthase [Candidatus Sumerlaeota bacterium]|nr:8-amino-7-oxononanoate synthase [Candidatus Sumerlaeota bacterium]